MSHWFLETNTLVYWRRPALKTSSIHDELVANYRERPAVAAHVLRDALEGFCARLRQVRQAWTSTVVAYR
jgi:hypothetical protein